MRQKMEIVCVWDGIIRNIINSVWDAPVSLSSCIRKCCDTEVFAASFFFTAPPLPFASAGGGGGGATVSSVGDCSSARPAITVVDGGIYPGLAGSSPSFSKPVTFSRKRLSDTTNSAARSSWSVSLFFKRKPSIL